MTAAWAARNFRWTPVSICSTVRCRTSRARKRWRSTKAKRRWAFIEGGGMELEDILREQILLVMPMQRVCSEDCKGICPVCGGNRNETPCDCKEQHAEQPVGRSPRSERPENTLKAPRVRGKLFEVHEMPNPKRRHSNRRTQNSPRARCAEDARDVRMPQLPRAEAAAPRVPALRTVQGPRSGRSRAGVASRPTC